MNIANNPDVKEIQLFSGDMSVESFENKLGAMIRSLISGSHAGRLSPSIHLKGLQIIWKTGNKVFLLEQFIIIAPVGCMICIPFSTSVIFNSTLPDIKFDYRILSSKADRIYGERNSHDSLNSWLYTGDTFLTLLSLVLTVFPCHFFEKEKRSPM